MTTNGGPTYLRDLWHFVQRNRYLVLGVPALTVLATLAFVQLATPVYEAEAQIRVDEERPSMPMGEALRSLAVLGGAGSRLHTEMAVLRTRVVAEDVVDSLNLHVTVRSPREVPRTELFDRLSADRTAPEARYRLERSGDGFRVRGGAARAGAPGVVVPGERLVLPGLELVLAPGALAHDAIDLRVEAFPDALRRFRRTVRIHQPAREADIIAVSYQGTDRRLVRDVPAAMARVFIDRRQASKSAEARDMVEFLDGQIALVASQLQAMEDDLLRFRETHRVVAVETEAKTEIERLARMQAERDAADAERTAIVASLDRIAEGGGSVARRLMYFPTLLRSAAASELMVMLADLENRRSELLELRTPEDPEVMVLTDRIEDLERELAANALTYVDGLSNQVASYDRTLERFRSQLDLVPARHIQLARMEREAGLLEEMYLLLETRRKQSEIEAAITDHTVQVVDPPALPSRPVRPRKLVSLLMAGILGTVLGFGAAFTREQMDTRVRTREDLRTASGEVPILGAIPRMPHAAGAGDRPAGGRLARVVGRRGNGKRLALQERLVTGVDPASPISEAYRSLRTNITFARLDTPPRTLVFTSAMPGEGKSTSASNLAITLAQQGLESVLVDADLRRGTLHQAFGAAREPGLAEALLDRAALEEVVQLIELERAGGTRLRFIPSGACPPHPAELLGSARMRELLAELVDRYDTVIIDAPPLNLVTDAAILGTHADGVIVVARAGATDRGALAHAVHQLEAVRAPILGTVLNDVDVRTDRYYGGAYAHAAGHYGRD
jgi:capsular exopolysaccharide synthesis family protein